MDKGDGRCEVAYRVTTAGPVSIAASLPGQAGVRLFEAQCEAAGAALGRCTVAAVAEALVAGDTGALVFWQADRCAAELHCSLLGSSSCCHACLIVHRVLCEHANWFRDNCRVQANAMARH